MATSVVVEALEEIYERHGELRPDDVVKAAKPRNHPLHDRFEWDDSKAAENYRIEQARRLIQSVEVVFVTPSGEETKIRAYASKYEAGKTPPGYHKIDKDFESEVDRAYLLRTMEREWRAMESRWSHLKEFWALVDASRRKRAG
jgi:hypothetical protein